MENLINIPGRLHSVAIEQHVAGANEIYDDNQDKLQDEINSILVTNSITNVQYIDGQLRFYNSKGHIVKVISTPQEQSDYAETDSSKVTFIKNKPTIPSKTSDLTNDSGFITDISGKQDVIEDLDDIRAGADAGATAYQKPQTGIPSTDMSSAVQTSLGKADTALQTETDPTVPAWAKAQNKPTYTAQEVGALPDSTSIPSALSDLTDDATHRTVTDTEKTAWNNKVNNNSPSVIAPLTVTESGGDYWTTITAFDVVVSQKFDGTSTPISLKNLATTVGNKVDKVSGKGLSTNDYTTAEKNKLAGIAAGAEVNVQSDWNESDTSSKAYINGKPTIPDISNCIQKSSTPGLVKNDGSIDTNTYLTQHQDISGKADKVSSATNGNFAALDSNGNLTDSGHKHSDYLTSHQDLTNYVQKSQTAGLLKNDGTVDTTQYLSQHQDISGKEDITPIEAVASGTTAITAQVNKYYEVAGTVSSLTVTLPTPTANTEVTMVVVHLTVGASPTILVTSVNEVVKFSAAYSVVANKEYELSCLYNGSKWIVSSMEVAA